MSDDDVICISDSDDEEVKNVPAKSNLCIPKKVESLDSLGTTNTIGNGTINGSTRTASSTAAVNLEVTSEINAVIHSIEGDDEDHQPSSSSALVAVGSCTSKGKVLEVIDIDDEFEEMLPGVQIPKIPPHGREMAKSALEDLIFKLKAKDLDYSMKERGKIKTKLWEKFEKVDVSSVDAASQVTNHIRDVIRTITGKTKWTKISSLMTFLDGRNKKHFKHKSSTETPEERVERKKQEKILLVEKRLKKMEKAIEEWDHREVDLDDEVNSAYLVKTRMVNEYMKHFKTLCRESGSTYYTGRPIEKRVKLRDNITRFPEINEAVEQFVNSKSVLYIPDFKNILDIVSKINDSSRPPLLCKSEPNEVHEIAETLFIEVMKILHRRRAQDLEISLPLLLDDPADHDPELEKKLKENENLGAKEKDIIEEFVKKQKEQNASATEVVDENPDESAGESDDEDDEDDLKAEGDSKDAEENGSNSNDEPIECKKEVEYTRNQVDEDEDDLDEENFNSPQIAQDAEAEASSDSETVPSPKPASLCTNVPDLEKNGVVESDEDRNANSDNAPNVETGTRTSETEPNLDIIDVDPVSDNEEKEEEENPGPAKKRLKISENKSNE